MTRSMLILTDRRQHRLVREVRGSCAGDRLVAIDADLHASLQDGGVEHRTPWDTLDESDRAALHDFRERVVSGWDHAAHVEIDGVDLLRVARYRHLRCLTRLAWTFFAVRRIVEAGDEDELVVVRDGSPSHGLDRPPGDPRFPLLAAVVAAVADVTGRTVAVIDEPSSGRVERPAAAGDDGVGKKCGLEEVVLYGTGPELLRHRGLRSALARRGYRTSHVHRATARDVVERLDGDDARVVDERQVVAERPLGETDAATIRAARRSFERRVATLDGDVAALLAHDRFRPHLDFIFGPYVRQVARRVAAWRAALRASRPRLFVASYPAPPLDAAIAEGIPTLVLPHGLMLHGDRTYAAGLPAGAIIGAVSRGHAAALRAWGTEPVRVTGDPGAAPALTPRPDDTAPSFATRSRRRRLLLPVAQSAAAAHLGELPEGDWARQRVVLQEIARMTAAHADWELIIRPHPRFGHDPVWARAALALVPEGRARTDDAGALAAAVRDADVVLFPFGRSSAIVEASGRGRPVVIVGEGARWLDRRAWGLAEWPFDETVAGLETRLVRLFGDPAQYDHDAACTRRAVRAFLDGGESAIDTTVEVIDSVAALPSAAGAAP